MKTKIYVLKIVLLALCVIGCSSDDDGNSGSGDIFGNIQLSGTDTSTVGSVLVVGNIDESALSTTGTTSSVVLFDENTSIVGGELVSTDFTNGFVIVAAQFDSDDNAEVETAISMTIVKNSEEFSYVCTNPPSSGGDNTDCGTGFSVDKIAKKIVFDNTTVINVDSGAILTMDGIINY
ncbi:hypothetical protein [Psychroserpens algicola]|uniref:Uncharacterized protein n=1 Tax=Psychroserpens algicola TaxID=1719034 RepID=A0ABT0HCC1_9FLAO|nr:hypothetical protein [Psychroserpens algicola]MCK8482008.1 hypothetical protein [Psychroserpens algicola]